VRRVQSLLLILLAWTAGLSSTAGAAPTPEPGIPQVLRWANDAEGGAPYIFHPAEQPDQLVGFEVELAQALCDRLGCQSRFVQFNWANLIPAFVRAAISTLSSRPSSARRRTSLRWP